MRDTMDMACDAGLVEPLKTGGSIWYPEKLADFAALVAAASAAEEREACARVCENSEIEGSMGYGQICAEIIRLKGNT